MAAGIFGTITSPPLALYEPSRVSVLRSAVSPAHDARASVAITVMMNLFMMVVGCEFWGLLAEREPPKGADSPVDNASLDCADAVKMLHRQQKNDVCHLACDFLVRGCVTVAVQPVVQHSCPNPLWCFWRVDQWTRCCGN